MRHPWIILFDIDGTMLTVDPGFNLTMLRELLDEHCIDYPDMEMIHFLDVPIMIYSHHF